MGMDPAPMSEFGRLLAPTKTGRKMHSYAMAARWPEITAAIEQHPFTTEQERNGEFQFLNEQRSASVENRHESRQSALPACGGLETPGNGLIISTRRIRVLTSTSSATSY
jgi:hypothetical protein